MLKIWTDLHDTKEKHVRYCKQHVEFRFQQYTDGKILNNLSKPARQSFDTLLALAIDHIDEILGGRIQVLKALDEKFKAVKEDYRVLKDSVLKIFDYRFFSYTGLPFGNEEKLWGSYQLADEIGLKTCPYCNENYTYSVYNNVSGKIRAELDHFLPLSEYPFFALSFYNLIPVCHSCNHVKLNQQIEINPHDDHFSEGDKFRFDHSPLFCPLTSNDEGDSKIVFESDDQRKIKQVEKLYISERYNHHKDLVFDILKKQAAYNTVYNESIRFLVPALEHLSDNDIHRLVYGVSSLPQEYHERPLSKLTNDILYQFQSG